MIYLQITFCLLVIVSSVRLMPLANVEEETETTEWTHDITTEEAAATTWLAPESLTKEIVMESTSRPTENNKDPALLMTTEEPFNAVTDHDEPTAVWSPSQTIEIRLHPQSLRTDESKGSHQSEQHPTVAPLASQEFPVGPQGEVSSMATPSVVPSEEDVFGRRMAMEPQQQHGSFSGQTGRLRSRDSVGAALRRAVTGSPAVQKLQQSTTRMASSLPVSTSTGRDKAGALTGSRPGRKIVGFGSLSTLSNTQRVNSKTVAALRKETFFKNRQSGHGHGHGGDTPADTHMEPSPQWLYGTSKDARKTVESFRLSNNERLLVLGLRDRVLTTSTVSAQEAETSTTTTTSKPEEMESTTTTLTSTTTPVHPPVNDAISVTAEAETAASTRPTIPEVDSTRPETNDVPAQIKDAERETNDAIPEINHETSEQPHEEREGQATVTQATGHPETVTTSSTMAVSSTETNPFTSSKHSSTKSGTSHIPLDVEGEPIKNLDNSPLDAQSSSKQELGVLTAGDDCFGADCNGDQETGLNMGQLDHGGFDQEAHRYLVEEKTHDGYIIGEFGVVSRSSDLRAVRYTAHPSIDPQLIQEMLRTFWLLKTGEKE